MKRILLSLAVLSCVLLSCKDEKEVQVQVSAISLDVSELELKVGESYEFKAIHTPENAKAPTYEWSVSPYYPLFYDEAYIDVATIDQNGKFVATEVGYTTVAVISTDATDPVTNKRFSATCKVNIRPIEAKGVSLDKTEVELKGGESLVLTASIIPENTTDPDIYWTTSDALVATVTKGDTYNKAIVKALGAGDAIITALVGKNTSLSASCKVKVNPIKLEGLSLNESEKTVIQGESFTLIPVLTPEHATNKKISWSSSDESVAKVNPDGVVSTIHFGECVIKAISDDGGFEASCKVTVNPVPVESVSFNVSSCKIEIGGTKQLTVTVLPDNAGNKKVRLESSDPIVASIDENGLVIGNKRGDAVITAVSEDGGHTSSCDVSVVDMDGMMNVYFPSSSVAIINGFYTGAIACAIRNNSSHSVRLTRFYVMDTNSHRIVAETTDESLLGVLDPGKTVALSGQFRSVYEPVFSWEFECDGRVFHTYDSYKNRSQLQAQEVEPTGKKDVQVQLNRMKQ